MDEFDARREAMDLVTAFVGNHKLTAAELPALLTQVFNAISGFAAHEAPPKAEAAAPEPALASPIEENELASTPAAPARPAPAVSIEESVSNPDFIISLISGQKLKTLKRHLRVHGLTEAEYRDRYDLPSDYPFVARSYSETRRQVAAKMGLGRRSTPEPDAAAVSETTPSAALEAEAAPKKPKRSKAKSAKPSPVGARPKRPAKAAAPKSKSAAPAHKASTGQEPKAETLAEALPQMVDAKDEATGAANVVGAAETEKAAPAKGILTAADKPGRAKRAVKEPKRPSPPRQPRAGPGARPKSAAPDEVATQGPSKKSAGRKHVTAAEASSPAETSSATVEPSVDTSGVATRAKRPRRKLSPTFN